MPDSHLVWFITGATAGFGLLLTQLALSHGHVVIATGRSLDKFPAELINNPDADLIQTQMTASSSEIAGLIETAVSKHGRIDVLVNNAGYARLGAVEEVTEAEVRHQFDVNFFGLFNFTKAVIPHMREQRSGTILQLSSGAGILAGHGGPVYSASKFAVEGLSEALALELKPLGIRVHLIEPGIFRTDFLRGVSKGENVSKNKDGYIDIGSMLSPLHGQQPGDPEEGVLRMFELVTGTGLGAAMKTQLRVPLGSDVFGMLETKIAMLKETSEKTRQISHSTDFVKVAE